MRKVISITISILIGLLCLRLLSMTTGSICLVRSMVGIPCPGCGLTRSLKALLGGRYDLVVVFNPLIYLVIILGILIILSRYSKSINKFVFNRYFIITLLIIVVGVYIYRMCIYFPNRKPMIFNDRALIPRCINWIRKIK